MADNRNRGKRGCELSGSVAHGNDVLSHHRITTTTVTHHSRNFCLVDGVLYHKGGDGIWRRGVHQDEKEAVLREAHCGTVEAHYNNYWN